MDKTRLRERIIVQRLSLDAQEVERKSRAIVGRLMGLAVFRRATTIFCYVAFRNEVETRGFIQESLAAGKRVAVPLVDRANRRLLPIEIVGLDDLAPGTWGIPEPKPGTGRAVDPRSIDLAVVPGVAFDRWGNRVGYGGGFYDRFLPGLRPGSWAVGLAYRFQIVEDLAPDPTDVPVHCVVTEEEVICCRKH